MIWKRLYNSASVSDFGTLVQLKNLINRKNVVSAPKDNVDACDDFLILVVTCHFLTVVMNKLGIECLDDMPTKAVFTQMSWMMSNDDQRSAIYCFCQDIIKECVHLPKSAASMMHTLTTKYLITLKRL